MPQLVGRGADVGAHGLPHQALRVVAEPGRQQTFDGGADLVDDRIEIVRLILRRSPNLVERRLDRPAPGVAEDHHEPGAELRGGELDAADQGGSDDVSRHPDDEQVAQALVEDDLDRYPGVGAAENGREGRLALRQFAAAGLAGKGATARSLRHEAAVPLAQAVECFSGCDHRHFILSPMGEILSR
jgi:hypothetical protein